MRDWFRKIWLTMYYYTHRKQVHQALAEKSKVIQRNNELVIEELGPPVETRDCAITMGWATICCTPNVTRAHCNELAATDPDYVGQWVKGACLQTKAKPCSVVLP